MKKIKKSTNKNASTTETTAAVVIDSQDTASIDPAVPSANEVQKFGYFITPIYYINKPEFLDSVRKVSRRLLAEHEKEFPKLHPVYPVRQTNSLLQEEDLKEFFDFVGYTGWNALQSEGYDMQNFSLHFQEAWVQEHHKHSGHDEHVHAFGSQLIGFYFYDTPEDSGRLVVHDPRPGKRQINLPEADMNMPSDASTAINFEPKAGDLFFAPSWAPHSISRHAGNKPLRMIHMTMSVSYIPPEQTVAPTPNTGAATII
jgi:uncharacterized protein (TIGR02466 family)